MESRARILSNEIDNHSHFLPKSYFLSKNEVSSTRIGSIVEGGTARVKHLDSQKYAIRKCSKILFLCFFFFQAKDSGFESARNFC